MELLYQNLEALEDCSFKALHVKRPYFIVPLHYHPEIEIMYIMQGRGTRVVGDSVESFSSGDFVLVGSNTPHVWKSNKEHYEERDDLFAECLVLFIPPKTLGDEILPIPEMSAITKMLEDGKRGIKFKKDEAAGLREMMVDIYSLQGMDRMLKVVELLHKMSQCKHTHYLSSIGYESNFEHRDFDRLSRCVEYLLQHYDQKIELETLADLANLTPNSFCRYFKKRTTKTFSEFLTELRLGKACQLLMESDKTISQIAFESGFSSLSNFNDQFKKFKHESPRKYRSHNRSLVL